MEKWQLENENNIQKIKNIIEFFEKNNSDNIIHIDYVLRQMNVVIKIENDLWVDFYYYDDDFSNNFRICSAIKKINNSQLYTIFDFIDRSNLLDFIDERQIQYSQKEIHRYVGKECYDYHAGYFKSKVIDKNKIKSELEKYRTLKQLENF
jgi:hypothetical protein